MLSPVTAQNLGLHAPELPVPWPAEAREALLDLLSGGPQLVPVWEALDLAGCITRWIPCWEPIQARPQHNPIHRHTVDRHSVQTVAEANRHLTRVDRPTSCCWPASSTTSASCRAPAPITPRSGHR